MRRTTPEDVLAFRGAPPQYRILAYSGFLNGELMGIGGVYFAPDRRPIIFFDCKEDTRKLGWLTLAKTGLKIMQEISDRNFLPVYAVADTTQPRAEVFLEWLGFYRLNSEVWIYDEQV